MWIYNDSTDPEYFVGPAGTRMSRSARSRLFISSSVFALKGLEFFRFIASHIGARKTRIKFFFVSCICLRREFYLTTDLELSRFAGVCLWQCHYEIYLGSVIPSLDNFNWLIKTMATITAAILPTVFICQLKLSGGGWPTFIELIWGSLWCWRIVL